MKNALRSFLDQPSRQPSLFADFDPDDPQIRQLYIADHPLMRLVGGYSLPTPPVEFAFGQIAAGIATGLPGMAWVAYPRFGKTSASLFIQTHLGETLEGTPIVVYVPKAHMNPDEGRFYKELLIASGFGIPPGRDVTERFSRLWKGWWAWVVSTKAKKVVLIIDEAQKLSVMEFSWLIDIANELAQVHVSLCVVLFAQPELVGLRNTFLHAGRMDIVGRFMVQLHNFEGIRSASELASVMEALDNPDLSEYPTGSGCSCTRFFASKAYAAGWRLHHHAGALWAAFEQCAANAGDEVLAHGISVAMAWVRLAFVYVMQVVMDIDAPILELPADIWKEAAERSGFQQSLGVIARNTPANAQP